MSRSRLNSNGVPVSLFPFLAVLLCTMGSLVMLLVAMNHIARRPPAESVAEAPIEAPKSPSESPLQPPAPEPQPDEPQPDEAAEAGAKAAERREQLEKIEEQTAKLRRQRDKADEMLREDNLRLSQIEGHIARQTDHLRSLRAAYQEMIAGGQENYDDLAQAERSLEQLQQLIEEEKQEIERIKEEQEGQSRSFAVLPYRGRNGSLRRPLYIECRRGEVVLQPEGLKLVADDFRRPLGPGNPLAAALRASREYHARQNPGVGYDPDAEPYPLILVRPDGIEEYYNVREAIRSWDADFGYEMVSADMNLAFPPPNPALYQLQAEAVQQTRLRRAMLARAAPSAYGGHHFSADGTGERSGGSGSPYDGQILGPPDGAIPGDGGGGGGGSDSVNGQPGLFADTGERDAGEGGREARAGEYSPPEASAEGGQLFASGGAAQGSAAEGGNGQNASPATQATAAGAGSPSDPQASGLEAAAANASLTYQPGGKRAENWAVDKSAPTDIAIARPVPIVVRRNRIEVGAVAVAVDGSTEAALPEFVAKVKRQVRSWGLAGQGLYWRPVLKMTVAPDGVERAQELVRLLAGSGIEISYPQTADAQGGSDATR